MRNLYAVIDITVLEETKILYVAELQPATLWGRILADQNRKVIAPALNHKAFTKLEQLPLQYLYWNSFGNKTPAEDYTELLQNCLTEALLIPVDKTDLYWLERKAAEIEQKQAQAQSQSQFSKPYARQSEFRPIVPKSEPRNMGATKKVWDIADQLMQTTGKMPDRQALIDECVRQGINSSTASTQFSKWRKQHVRSN